MAEVIELLKIDRSTAHGHQEYEHAVDQVVASLRTGDIVVMAAEHGYLYVCDAFNRDGIVRMHTLRADDYGTACQVMIGSMATLGGIAQNVSEDLEALTSRFWPGLLTLQVQPHIGLNWDLGDGGELSEFAVRIPRRDFLLAVLAKSGPLAVSSAALAGRPPVTSIGQIAALYSDIAIYVDEGELVAGPASTVVRQKVLGLESDVEVVRVGAISLDELAQVVPAIAMMSQ